MPNNLTNILLFSSQESAAAWLTAKLLFCLNNSVSAESNMRKGRLNLLYYRVPIVREYVIFPRSDVCFLSRFVSQLLNVSSMVIVVKSCRSLIPVQLFCLNCLFTPSSQLIINTAIVYMHRFYMIHSFTKFHRNVSMATFLA